jgi:pimeloyl-ACP methyl ester carboxylesterase
MKLVLIPGLDGTGDLFADFVDALGHDDVLVIRYPPDRQMDYPAHEAFVRERLPTTDFVLLAESFSGPVGVSIAASGDFRLKGLVLCASFAANPLPVFGPLSRICAALPAVRLPPALFAPWLYAGFATPELRRAHAAAMNKVSASTLQARVAAILRVDYLAQLRLIQVPMLYLLATSDRLIPRSALGKIQRVRPDIQVAEFDAPHFLLQTRPRETADRVARFLAG